MEYPEISEHTKVFWQNEDFESLYTSKNIAEVFEIAKRIIMRMPENIAQVCGPVTSGGKGNIKENLIHLNTSIKELQQKGIPIFDQMPFEETFHRIVKDKSLQQEYVNILNDFYEPLFRLNKIKTLYFVPGWESSRGANWEYEKAKELKIEIKFL